MALVELMAESSLLSKRPLRLSQKFSLLGLRCGHYRYECYWMVSGHTGKAKRLANPSVVRTYLGGTSPILFFLWLDVRAVCLSAAYHPIRGTGTNLRESRYISGARGTAGVGLSLINPQPSQAKVIPTIRLSQLSTAYGA